MANPLNEESNYMGISEGASSLAEKAQDLTNTLSNKAHELGKQAQHMTETFAGQATEVEEMMRTRLTDLEDQARVFIRQQPMVAILGAVGLGYIVARMMSRESR